jgi:hypothetical protein
MARAELELTVDDIAARFQEAVDTARRLPPVRVQGYFNTWPQIVRQRWEAFGAEERHIHRFPPSPEAIDRMLEVMRWVHFLDVQQRHMVWMRAQGHCWRDISRRFGCDRSTAWRRWQRALEQVALQLISARQSGVASENLSNSG